MSEPDARSRNKKSRRAALISVGLFAVLVAGGLVFSFIERVREASDRAT